MSVWTDAYLAALASVQGMRLVTLDRSLRSLLKKWGLALESQATWQRNQRHRAASAPGRRCLSLFFSKLLARIKELALIRGQ